ncbi:class A beta-lactamase-related serine hydrolase [Luteimonas sp BLCC-B24]|uniref:serine hydrolase n=1 Tax=Luteimonas sp. BLCC-B24 TaxID=3025317 RepID=UPI00234C191D|nr:serine hydrolase [Luteimonas sp. BLCC-B24]MDC7807825.1 class A beta-lactamase-related serine hydrolase [Luteimonas sp. BLCC-B24]
MFRFSAAFAVALLLSGTTAAQPTTSARPVPVPDKAPIHKTALTPAPPWAAALERRVRAIDAAYAGDIGVHVHHLGRNETWGLRDDEIWYLASGVKVPVAIAVMREIEQGWLTLDTRVTLQPTDVVDGAGQTNAHRPGTRLTIAYLIEQMIIYSDNTATDMLIRTVGLGQVNAVAAELISARGAHITSLADVRRRAYGMLHSGAAGLSSADLLALQRAGAGPARVRKLAQILDVAPADLLLPDLDSAFESYYATHANSASLRDYGRMLAALQQGRALDAEGTRYLLDVMGRVQTGRQRIRAGLPAGATFAHKTGTQYRRLCDSGIVTMPSVAGAPPVRVVIAACVRGATGAVGERALRDIGAAVTAAGVLRAADPTTPRR